MCLFATDLTEFPYSIKGLHQIFLECNYSEEIRVNAVLNGADVRSSSQTHMELNTCIDAINRLKSPELSSVILLHLSDSLSDAEGFKKRLSSANELANWYNRLSDSEGFQCRIFTECGVRAEIAEKNIVISLAKADFWLSLQWLKVVNIGFLCNKFFLLSYFG